ARWCLPLRTCRCSTWWWGSRRSSSRGATSLGASRRLLLARPGRSKGDAPVKSLIAAVVAAIPGMLVGVVLWTVLATCVLVVYWVGYEFLYLGLLCSKGKFGLGWFTPPSQATQDATREWSTLLTVFAFTFGEVVAGALGAVFGGAAGVAGLRLFRWLR